MTKLTLGLLQNLYIYMLRNMVDLVDFDLYSRRRLIIFNICVSEKLVDYVELGFASKSMSRNVVDLFDFDFNSQRRPTFLNICLSESWLTRLT